MRKAIDKRARKTAWWLSERLGRLAGAEALWVPPGHFYSPITDRQESLAHLDRVERLAKNPAIPGIHLDREHLRQVWHQLLPSISSPTLSATPKEGLRYSTRGNFQFPWVDALVLHSFMRHTRPRKIIEIGSGHSSACMLDTAERHLDECAFTFIDPNPERLMRRLRPDDHRHKIIRSRVQDVPIEIFDQLEADDILFIDSSHVAKTGSDVCFELFEILPRLAEGVLVHVHDIFWPFEYSRRWTLDQNRSWNEALFLRAFLMGNRAWRIEMFNDWMFRFEKDLLAQSSPAFLARAGGSIWLRRVGPD